jgi:hypothetical protein
VPEVGIRMFRIGIRMSGTEIRKFRIGIRISGMGTR